MNESARYRINKPDVILENFDGEVVIVNLVSGNYYSIDAIGAEIWTLAQQGFSVAEIASGMTKAHEGSQDIISAGVLQFMQELLTEGLIVPDANAAPLHSAQEQFGDSPRNPFIAPVLNKYTDMQELLVLDPIHEVDETGWPNPADSSSAPKA